MASNPDRKRPSLDTVPDSKRSCLDKTGSPSTSTTAIYNTDLISHPTQSNTKPRTNKPDPKLPPLIMACANGHYKVVKLLLDRGEDVDVRVTSKTPESTPLMAACWKGHVDIVELVLRRGATVNVQNDIEWSALTIASCFGHSDVVKLLIDNGAQVNMLDNDKWPILMLVSQLGHTDVVKLLIDNGAEVNMQNRRGWSALMIASQKGHSDVVKLLIDNGAEINMLENDRWSALMLASQIGHDVVKPLIENGAEVNMQNDTGFSALMLASPVGHSDVVKLLIDKGAKVNVQANNGLSALILASISGQTEIVRLLVENHADTSLQDIYGWSALDYVCRDGHADIVDILYSVEEQEETDNSEASIQAEKHEIRSESCTTGESTNPLANEDTTDHSMNEGIISADVMEPDIKSGCHGNQHKQIIEPVTTDEANKDEASEDSSPDVLDVPQLEIIEELKVVTDPLQLDLGLEKSEKENKQDASGPLSGPSQDRSRPSTVDADSSSHPANVVLRGHCGQSQLPGTSPTDIANSAPSNGDRPSPVKGDASSTTKRHGTESPHQQRTKLTIEQLNEKCNLTDEQLKREIRHDELLNIAELFDGWSKYVDTPGLGLTRGEQAQIRDNPSLDTNAMRMKEALRIWKSKNPFAATFLSLLNILLELKTQGDLAREICEHLKTGVKQELISDPAVECISKDLVLFKEKPIGGGAFGTVFRGELNGEPCAVKLLHALAAEIRTSIPTAVEAKQDSVKRFIQECQYLESFQHPNVVRHLATRHHPKTSHLVLALELMDCNLRQFFTRQSDQDHLPIPIQKSLCHNVASALAYIHSQGVVHRDLCSDNILLDCKGENPVAKVCDFGMSRIIKSEGTSLSLPTLGHRGYLPPEATDLESTRYDSRFDIFSFGAIMVQIIRNMPTIKDRKERTYHLKQINSTHPLKPLVVDCLQENRDDRPSASRLEKELAPSP